MTRKQVESRGVHLDLEMPRQRAGLGAAIDLSRARSVHVLRCNGLGAGVGAGAGEGVGSTRIDHNTVRDGIEGVRVPTALPALGAAAGLVMSY